MTSPKSILRFSVFRFNFEAGFSFVSYCTYAPHGEGDSVRRLRKRTFGLPPECAMHGGWNISTSRAYRRPTEIKTLATTPPSPHTISSASASSDTVPH